MSALNGRMRSYELFFCGARCDNGVETSVAETDLCRAKSIWPADDHSSPGSEMELLEHQKGSPFKPAVTESIL